MTRMAINNIRILRLNCELHVDPQMTIAQNSGFEPCFFCQSARVICGKPGLLRLNHSDFVAETFILRQTREISHKPRHDLYSFLF